MNFKYLAAFTALALLLTGCGDKNAADATTGTDTPSATTGSAPAVSDSKIVGQWTADLMPGFTVDFKNDGTMTANGPMPGKPEITINTSSTWKVEGDKLTTTGTGITVEGADEATKKAMEDGGKAQLGKPLSGTIKWEGDDKFTVTADEGGVVVTYTRKK
jgi:hypothetical protein